MGYIKNCPGLSKMVAFPEHPSIESFDYLRRVAEDHNCRLSFDDNIKKILRMNEKGNNGVLACLCKVNTTCPCEDLDKDLETEGHCYCNIMYRSPLFFEGLVKRAEETTEKMQRAP